MPFSDCMTKIVGMGQADVKSSEIQTIPVKWFIAENEPGSPVLVTCENGSAEGKYLNRRVVFVKAR